MLHATRCVVRLRPLTAEEATTSGPAWQVSERGLSLRRSTLERFGRADWLADSTYSFDAVFGGGSSTAAVYARAGEGLAESLLRGVNCTLLAYGQTSSGKTHTMLGEAALGATESAEPGLISLAVADVLRRVGGSRRRRRRYRLRVSCAELYNEMCNDLLAPERTNLKLYERAGGVLVSGLSEWELSDVEMVEPLLRAAEVQRHVGSTGANDRSSRSHLIFSLIVESWPLAGGGWPAPEAWEGGGDDGGSDDDDDDDDAGFMGAAGSDGGLQAQAQLVDLAGSERRHGMADAQQGQEGGHINKSLLALSTIIHRLADDPPPTHTPAAGVGPPPSPRRSAHLPYRDSKLTRLLQPCLGGASRAVIVSTICPAAAAVDETLATLRFACVANRVVTSGSEASAANGGGHVDGALLSRLSAEVAYLRSELSAATRPPPARPPPAGGSGAAAGGQRRIVIDASAAGRAAAEKAAAKSSPAAPAAAAGDGAPAAAADADDGAAAGAQDLGATASSPEWRRRLQRLGVDPHVARGGSSLLGLHALQRAASLRETLSTCTSALREPPPGAAAAAARGGNAKRNRRLVGAADAAEGWRLPRRAGGSSIASADAELIDSLESQIVEVLVGTGECVGALLSSLERVQRVARATEEAAPAGRRGAGTAPTHGAAAGDAGLLRADRARAVRQSRKLLGEQHDMLTTLMMRRVGLQSGAAPASRRT